MFCDHISCSLVISSFLFVVGQKKLGKVITPDPWKAGARNTTGDYAYSFMLLAASLK